MLRTMSRKTGLNELLTMPNTVTSNASLDQIGRQYVRLVLSIARWSNDDHYTISGAPKRWREEVFEATRRPREELLKETASLMRSVHRLPVSIDAHRRERLKSRLLGLKCHLERLLGKVHRFDREAQLCFGFTPPRIALRRFEHLAAKMDPVVAWARSTGNAL